jgi:hypothetical protein
VFFSVCRFFLEWQTELENHFSQLFEVVYCLFGGRNRLLCPPYLQHEEQGGPPAHCTRVKFAALVFFSLECSRCLASSCDQRYATFRGVNDHLIHTLQSGFPLLRGLCMLDKTSALTVQGWHVRQGELMQVFVGFRPHHIELGAQDIEGRIRLRVIEHK